MRKKDSFEDDMIRVSVGAWYESYYIKDDLTVGLEERRREGSQDSEFEEEKDSINVVILCQVNYL